LAKLDAKDRLHLDIKVTYSPSRKGEPRLGRATMTVELIDGVYRVTALIAEGPEDSWLDLEAVRAMRFSELVVQGLVKAVRYHHDDGKTYTAEKPLPEQDPLRFVALTYAMARAAGQHPTARVAEDLGISREAAAQRVKRARDAGYLPPTEPGKVS
jgi:hypothetical protein